MAELKETCWDHVQGESFATYFSGEQKWINKFRKDAEKYPDQVVIKHVNEDGSMIVRYPYAWCKLPSPPRKMNMTEERRAECGARLKAARDAQKLTAE